MPAASTQNQAAARPESKSAKKKKAAKAEAAAAAAPAASPAVEATQASSSPTGSANGDASDESSYIKELQKNIRNVNKKITNASKVDHIIAENPGMSLDDLVAARKINQDQKAQVLKKPNLQATLAQLEEQIVQYKKFDQEYKSKAQAEKAELEKAFAERQEQATKDAAKQLEEAVAKAKEEVAAEALKQQQENMLLLSQFLRLAASRRAEGEDPTLEENQALEGILLQLYSGDEGAVVTMQKLIESSEETTTAITGETLRVTFKEIREAVLAHAPVPMPTEEAGEEATEEAGLEAGLEEPVAEAEPSPAVETKEYPIESDPTIANAGLTELDAPVSSALPNGLEGEDAEPSSGIPQNSGFGEGAANAAAEANWDNNNDLSTSQEWVEVPRDAAETDTGVSATPAANTNTQSWADDQPENPPVTEISQALPTAPTNDGFQDVPRRGGPRGRGRGDYRGRGSFRGDGYRGRGRGGGRGGASRGGGRQRRSDESQ